MEMDRRTGFVGSFGAGGWTGRNIGEKRVCSRSGRGLETGRFRRRSGGRVFAAADGSSDVQPIPQKSNGNESSVPWTPQKSGLSASQRFGPSSYFEGIKGDIARRAPYYWNDWKVGFNVKSISATLFLFFACYAPVVAFGGLTAVITQGSLGIVELILAASVSGTLYAVFAGQPLTIIGPTGLTLAFTAALYSYCGLMSIPFLPMYAWTGIWTGGFLILAGIMNTSDVIIYCTRFTDDVFNSLIAVTFVSEAVKSLVQGFVRSGADKTRPFMALTIALGTFLMGRFLAEFRKSRYLLRSVRTFLSDFGPCIAIATMSLVAAIPMVSAIGLEGLIVPASISLANNRPLLVDIFSLPVVLRFAAAIPALLLTCLFFLDQNISVRVVHSASHRLRKGDAYHWDITVLGMINLGLSLAGLPWMCAATVQSLNHIRALAFVKTEQDSSDPSSKPQEVIEGVLENRVTGFAIHALIGASVLLLPLLKRIPMAVIAGLFLFLGRNIMTGNEFLRRIKLIFVDPQLYPQNSAIRKLRPMTVHLFTAIQLACLATLWGLKSNPRLSLFFPSVIGLLMVIRSTIVQKTFSPEALRLLDSDLDYSEESENSNLELYEDKTTGEAGDSAVGLVAGGAST